ncbi:MAG: PHB depolymerase family esterase, partial [Pseudomonadota bacterium]
ENGASPQAEEDRQGRPLTEMKHPRRTLLAAAALLTLGLAPAAACGPDTDCVIGERTYRIAMPDGATDATPVGAVVFMHGYRGTAQGTMASDRLRAMAQDLGVALIAPKSGGEDWLIRNAPRKGFEDDSRELAYFDALLADVTTRFPIDPGKILAAGFSAGGMMTWTLACHRPDRFAAFLPIAGTFWAPEPESCDVEAVDLVHIHGTADEVVPIAGRPIADVRQGDVRTAVARYGRDGGYAGEVSVATDALAMACEGSSAPSGAHLILCLHGGGHGLDADWVAWAYRTFVAGD